MRGQIDLLLFNPPYVPSEPHEIDLNKIDKQNIIDAAWAGGKDGREVLDKLIPQLNEIMNERGCVYIVCVQENKPTEICNIMEKEGFNYKFCFKKRAFNELLYILRFQKKKPIETN